MIKMINQNLLCKEIEEVIDNKMFDAGATVKRFKELVVALSSEDEIGTGITVTVPVNSGEIHNIDDTEYTIIKRSDIIFFE